MGGTLGAYAEVIVGIQNVYAIRLDGTHIQASTGEGSTLI